MPLGNIAIENFFISVNGSKTCNRYVVTIFSINKIVGWLSCILTVNVRWHITFFDYSFCTFPKPRS